MLSTSTRPLALGLAAKQGRAAFATAAAAPAAGKDKHGFRNVVLVDAVRTPFLVAGTGYKDLMAYDLQKVAIHNLLKRTAFDPSQIDRVICGTVIQEVKTSNIAREAALAAGVPKSVPANTVTMACISSNVAVSNGADLIRTNQADAILAGGVELMSDVPIRFTRKLRSAMLAAQKAKGLPGYMQILSTLKLKDVFGLELPAVAEFSTNEVMGSSADRLAAAFQVSRRDQDIFAVRSHQLAAKAFKEGKLKDLMPVRVPKAIEADNGVRGDSSLEKLSTLKPAFIKPHGTITAGNASYLTDGASACLIMSEERALALGYKPVAYLRDYLFVSQDPKEELLLGPAYAIARLLRNTGLTKNDVGVWELHEAFAGQVLANLNALDSDKFTKEKLAPALGLSTAPPKLGQLPMDKINNWGGSLSLGHPFGATGVRLVSTTAHRLHDENQQFGMLAACAAGGQATAMLIERYPSK